MSSKIAIEVKNVIKKFQVYDRPQNRLKQAIYPRFCTLLGLESRAYYQDFPALNNVSFTIKKGETVGIVGRNGSGKSTILQIICGTLSQTSGTVTTNGRIAALLELGSGFNPEFTGRENVYMNAAILGLSRQEIDGRFSDIEAFADIGDFIDQPVKTYSSGMMVRLAFAVSINVEPEILIVDEALAVGDELFQRKCYSRIEEIKKNGATILFVTHSASTIIELCDRAILMDSGECLGAATPKRIISCYQKLLYAADEKKQYVRSSIVESIKSEKNDSDLKLSTDVEHQEQETGGKVKGKNEKLKEDYCKEYFDPNLKPTSTIAYESNGAKITNPRITTIEGKEVNNLVRGRRYNFQYNVTFDSSIENVRFGMLIKTLSGVELGGAASSTPNNCIEHIDICETKEIKFSFDCQLNPGVYFLNAGVMGHVDRAETYLHRLIDIAMFRVIPEVEILSTGIIDFQCTSEVN
ncbi:Teichoic acid export ATP-binding protein TagH [Photobacterium marinum]|uniref:Teichoic acid export ATP-binding protein TagH n=1 Tax=Photobacterium marinum TaxID=1056511 RepID=L8J860_9GAMM|nr:ABC transporter ATP-binding protein [Photobacterium marinum]ELR65070.1 Teichoic acid export ATP-binding protein TagH [Photobacterium marinum]